MWKSCPETADVNASLCADRAGSHVLIVMGFPHAGAPADDDNSEAAEVRRNVMKLHVLLLRIALRLGENPRSSIVQQVVYR